ncbi:SMR family transporter [Paracoccus jiaweipingae]|uniref:SMR family transporter n=1 Tax=unclassified Paracoccus (in: a-proteobacteria) TaxID=2688777 RepID=UPI0037A0D389
MIAVFGTLFLAILLEVVGTSLLKQTQGFTRLWPTLAMAGCYIASLWLFSLTLRVMPLGVAYAIWAGLGIVLVALTGAVLFGQRLDSPALLGIALIVAGVLVINLLSKTVPH